MNTVSNRSDTDQQTEQNVVPVAWRIDLGRDLDSHIHAGSTFFLKRTVEAEEDMNSDESNPSLIDCIYWNLYRDGMEDANFLRRWWTNDFITGAMVESDILDYVVNVVTSRAPGVYKAAQNRIEIVHHDSAAQEIVAIYALNHALTKKIREIFGGNAIGFQNVRKSYQDSDDNLIDDYDTQEQRNVEHDIYVENGGQLRNVQIRF